MYNVFINKLPAIVSLMFQFIDRGIIWWLYFYANETFSIIKTVPYDTIDAQVS